MPINTFAPVKTNVPVQNNSTVTTPQTQTTQPVEPKGLSTSAKVGIGAAAVGAITIGVLLAKGKFSQAKQLAEHIDFKEAKTLEEAKKFAKENLGINSYNLTNLDIANYVNEALVNITNKNKGKQIFNKINTLPKEHVGWFSVRGKRLSVNESQVLELTNIQALTQEYNDVLARVDLSTMSLTSSQQELLKKAGKNIANLTMKEKIYLSDMLGGISGHENMSTYSFFKDALHNKEVEEFLAKNNLPQDFETFKALSPEEQGGILDKIFENTNYKTPVSDFGAFHPINHEMGHSLHLENVGCKKFNKYVVSVSGDPDKAKQLMTKKCDEFSKEEPEWHMLEFVSKYSMFSPGEAVAEIFAGLQNGVKFNDEIMAMYKKYGGPMVG